METTSGLDGDQPATSNVVRASWWARDRLLRLVAGGVAAAWLLGLLLLWLGPRSLAAMGCVGPLSGATLEHLGRCDRGVRVSASTQDLAIGQHALWAVDGRVGGRLEKWTSRGGDPRPWLLLEWAHPVRVGRVVIHHGGEREGPEHTVRDFTLSARLPDGWKLLAESRGNEAPVSVVGFSAVSTTALKLQVLKGDDATSCARVYEVEVHEH